ncbi:splicing regulator SDE2 [Hyperolius riggenbachi]|uniref:splicing regulator SDE2 n=1 Tax=Hyperolius riggenbachi TaxID=752182 RepID=UPI0035A3D4D3
MAEGSVVLVWRRSLDSARLNPVELPLGSAVRDLLPASLQGASQCDFYVTCNGRQIGEDDVLQSGLAYSVVPRLCGGKGGFGSMLRALGAQIEKTTNREACRDLSGRRLRDVNHEKAMAEWIKKQAEREAEKEQRRLERLKRKLEEPKHYFTDPEYHRQCSDMSERLEDSVIRGLQASSSSVVSPESSDCHKRKNESQVDKGKCKKKKFLWTGMEGLEVSSSSSDSDGDSDSESPSTSALCHSTEQRLQSSESDSDGPAQSSSVVPREERLPSEESDSDCPAQSSSVVPSEESDSNGSAQSSSDVHRKEKPPSEESDFSGSAQSSSVVPRGQGSPSEEIESDRPAQSLSVVPTEQRLHSGDRESNGSAPCSPSSTNTDQKSHSSSSDSDGQAQCSSSTNITELNPERTDDRKPAEEATDREQPDSSSGQTEPMEVTPEPQKPAANPELPQTSHTSHNTGAATFDLLSFSSAAELEALGLEKLKMELMALGLKCGGTLQERAARLFSVRGLSREQIDPSLFAKPAKPKKK